MQEDIERRTVVVAAKTGKLTAKVLAKLLAAAGRRIKKAYRDHQTPQGKQSVKKLLNHGSATSAIPINSETRLFDRVARKWNVDYAFYQVGPKKHLLFFKASQADAITQAFSEYTRRVMAKEKQKRPSILEQLRSAKEQIRAQPQREKTRETVRDER